MVVSHIVVTPVKTGVQGNCTYAISLEPHANVHFIPFDKLRANGDILIIK